MNKKTLGIVGIILLIVLLLISSMIDPDKKEQKEKLSNDINVIIANAQEESEEYKNSKEQKEFIEIDTNTYLEFYKGSEYKIVLVARPTCHYCQIAEPIIHKVAYDYDLEINYLNTDEFSEDDQSNFISSNEKFSEGFGTPMILIVGNNELKDTVDGLTDYAHYKKVFKDNNFIK